MAPGPLPLRPKAERYLASAIYTAPLRTQAGACTEELPFQPDLILMISLTVVPPEPPPLTALPVVGVDVSQTTLDVCVLHQGKRFRQRCNNTALGHAQLFEALKQRGVTKALVAMESTGPYHAPLATAAFVAGHQVVVFNPTRVLDYARSMGRRNKTDQVDAALIARFAQSRPHEPWQPLPADQAVLRELLRRQETLEQHLQAEKRRFESASMALHKSLQRSIRWIEAELQRLEKAVLSHLCAHPRLAKDIDRLSAISGVGMKTARLLVAEIPRHFRNARAVAAWLGVVPRQCQSGTSVRKGSRVGHEAPSLRAKLYFPAITAMRHDPRLKAFAERLRAADKPSMSVILAVIHKLIRMAFAILQSGADYNPNHSTHVPAPASCSP